MFKLVRYFSITSLILLGIVTIATVLILPKLGHTIFTQAESQKSAELTHIVANALGNKYLELVLNTELLGDRPQLQAARIERFDHDVQALIKDSSVAKIKLFSPEGLTIYSSVKDEIGLEKSTETGIQRAALFEEMYSSGRLIESFSTKDKVFSNRFIFSTHIPLKRDFNGEIMGVLEVYSDVTKTHQIIENAGFLISIASILFSAFVYGSLYLVVRRGENVIRKQFSEINQTRDKLEQQAEALQRSNKELERFAYIASHDLQEPLRKVQAFGDRLGKKYADVLGENGLMYLERMQDASARMRVLIQDLLSYSRVTSKEEPFESIDLNVIVKNVISDLEIRIEETKAKVTVDELPRIKADPLQMRQLFQNLVGNALKFQREGATPVIDINFEEQNGKLLISVKDNGVGFDKQYAEKVFEVFQRLHGRSEFEGTGMGLAIVRKIVERHGGTISAESKENEGATFKICFDANEVTVQEQATDPKQTLILNPVTA